MSSSGVKGRLKQQHHPISHITIPVVSKNQSPGPSSSEQEFSFQARKMTQEASTWTVPLLAGASLVSSIVTANLFLSTAAERPSKAMSLTVEVSSTRYRRQAQGLIYALLRIDFWPVKTRLPLSSVEKHGCRFLCTLPRHLLRDPVGAHDSKRVFAPGPHHCCIGVDASDGHAGRVRPGFYANNIQCPRFALGRVPVGIGGIEHLTEARNVGPWF